jgi:hypothetical protein
MPTFPTFVFRPRGLNGLFDEREFVSALLRVCKRVAPTARSDALLTDPFARRALFSITANEGAETKPQAAILENSLKGNKNTRFYTGLLHGRNCKRK